MNLVRLLTALVLVSASTLPAQQQRWSEDQANAWYEAQPWLVGANYVPSDAINQLEMFQAATWNPVLNDRELALAESAGMNTLRVFLHDLLWQQDSTGFTRRLNDFLSLCAKHHIRPILVLFDSVWDPKPHLGPQHPPIPGVHNSGWVQSPGIPALQDSSQDARLAAYVHGIIGAFAQDGRVLAWDIWNEPDNPSEQYVKAGEVSNKEALVDRVLPLAFQWARDSHPTQPLTSGVWSGNWSDPEKESPTVKIQLSQSDIITFHNYDFPENFEGRIQQLEPLHRPILCTEYMARGAGSTFDTILPIAKQLHVAAINWGLVNGRTQTNLPWDSWTRPYTLEAPVVWFHDVFHTDGTPYRTREIQLLRQLTGRGTE